MSYLINLEKIIVRGDRIDSDLLKISGLDKNEITNLFLGEVIEFSCALRWLTPYNVIIHKVHPRKLLYYKNGYFYI